MDGRLFGTKPLSEPVHIIDYGFDDQSHLRNAIPLQSLKLKIDSAKLTLRLGNRRGILTASLCRWDYISILLSHCGLSLVFQALVEMQFHFHAQSPNAIQLNQRWGRGINDDL